MNNRPFEQRFQQFLRYMSHLQSLTRPSPPAPPSRRTSAPRLGPAPTSNVGVQTDDIGILDLDTVSLLGVHSLNDSGAVFCFWIGQDNANFRPLLLQHLRLQCMLRYMAYQSRSHAPGYLALEGPAAGAPTSPSPDNSPVPIVESPASSTSGDDEQESAGSDIVEPPPPLWKPWENQPETN